MQLPNRTKSVIVLLLMLAVLFVFSDSSRLRKSRRLDRMASHRKRSSSTRVNINFSCAGRAIGYYADIDFDCRIFHVCDPFGRRIPMRCPPHTQFNQMYRVCDWPYNVDCKDSPTWFYMNGDASQRDAPTEGDDSNGTRSRS